MRTHVRAWCVTGVSLVCLAVFLLGACRGNGGGDDPKKQPPEPPVVEHVVTIMTSAENPDKCLCVDAEHAKNGEYVQEITARRGEWVVWENKTGQDIMLKFGMSKRLFGVKEAIVYAEGEPLKLRVRSDAAAGTMRYFPDCDTTEPPPNIIIPPPDEP